MKNNVEAANFSTVNGCSVFMKMADQSTLVVRKCKKARLQGLHFDNKVNINKLSKK